MELQDGFQGPVDYSQGSVPSASNYLNTKEAKRDVTAPLNIEGEEKTRFFWCESALLPFAFANQLGQDELLLYLLHCRGYAPKARVSQMGEKAARARIHLRKRPWTVANESLRRKGLLMPMPVGNPCFPKTAIGSPSEPYEGNGSAHEDRPSIWDMHRYTEHREKELIKMPWSLIDGGDGTQPKLGDLESMYGVLVALALYLVADEDGAIPRKWARMNKDMAFEHSLETILEEVEPGCVLTGLGEMLAAGLLYPACEAFDGGQQLRLYHPLEAHRQAAGVTQVA